MKDDEDRLQFEEFGGYLNALKVLHDRVAQFLPSVKVACPSASPEPIELLLGAWDGQTFATTFLHEVPPGGSFSVKLDSIVEFSDFKTGQSLLLRVKQNVAIYNLTNVENYFGYALTVKPPTYPWWPPTATAVRWGPSAPYLVQPAQTVYSYLTPDIQDVFYYLTVA